jgi:prefoldin subunit 5
MNKNVMNYTYKFTQAQCENVVQHIARLEERVEKLEHTLNGLRALQLLERGHKTIH